MRKPLCVLFVEDQEDDMLLVVHELRRGGYDPVYERVETAAAIGAALDRASWDLVIADYTMPQFGAPAALAFLQQRGLDVPFIIVSGTIGEERAVAVMKAGAHDYIVKNNLTSLVPAVARALQDAEVRLARGRAEEALRESEVRYRRLVETLPDAILLLSLDGTILMCNQKAVELHGYAQMKALLSRNIIAFIAPEDRQRAIDDLQQARDVGQIRDIEITFLKHDDTRFPAEVSASLIMDAEGRPITMITVVREITRRKQLEAQLLQSQKMESIGRLAGGIAHDFNNLLTVITGNAELALDALAPDNPLCGDLQTIKHAADRAAALTHQLLAFARKQILEPRVLNLNDLILDMDKLLGRLIGEDIELVTLPHSKLGYVKADLGQIEQVLANLVVNARDAMPEGGKLTIETKNVLLDEAYARGHASVTAGAYVMLAVSDTGTGILPEVHARLFEPFFTTKEPGKGTGLGLATCYGIVKQHGGNIWVYSEVGQGAVFKVYLPRTTEEGADARPRDAEAPKLPRGAETVLLVEDEPAVRELAARVLRGLEYTVLEATNGAEALRVATAYVGTIQLLVTDLVMPHMGGNALATQLAEVCLGIKVLFMSGYTENAIVHHGRLEKEWAFLQKPFAPATLAHKVREILDG